jgi:indole-3-acetate monooxygenase
LPDFPHEKDDYMTTVDTPQLTSLLSSVQALAPVVAAERQRLDTERSLSPGLIDALVEEGLFRLWTPREMGGFELDPVSGLRVIAAVAELDGSVGWNVTISSAHGFLAGRLPGAAAKNIYGDRRAAVAGQLQPRGKAEMIDGGYRVTGRWSFGSGSKQATWFLAQCVVHENGRPRSGADGVPEMRLVFVPADRCRIHDTWHVSGLRGTGSNDYSIENVDVPAEYCVDLFADRPTRAERLYAYPGIPMLIAVLGAVPVGIARAALEAFKAIAKTKKSFPSGQTLSEHPTVQAELARAEICARSAEMLLFHAVDDMWQTVQSGASPTLEQRLAVRLGCINAGVSSAQAVDIVYNLGGSDSIFEKNPLERCFRDVHVATQHAAVTPKGLEVAGRVLLGMEPNGLI